jgi:acyl-CoA thioester hydrolase
MREAIAHAGPTDRVPPFRFSAVSRVSFADTDLGAVAYYGRYAHHLDRAAIAYRRHLGIPPVGPEGHLFVVRSLAVEYRASARFDDEVEAFVRVTGLNRTSHEVEARLERLTADGPVHLADARLLIVGLADYGGRPTRIPAPMREAVTAFEGLAGGRT